MLILLLLEVYHHISLQYHYRTEYKIVLYNQYTHLLDQVCQFQTLFLEFQHLKSPDISDHFSFCDVIRLTFRAGKHRTVANHNVLVGDNAV